MQGLTKPDEKRIFLEMQKISKQEGFDLFLNENNTCISKKHQEKKNDPNLSIWGQDNKAFVKNKNGKMILWHANEKKLSKTETKKLGDYKINTQDYLPRGGNYYIGYNEKGTKWLLINNTSVIPTDSFNKFSDLPTKEHLYKFFDVKPQNIITIAVHSGDVDEFYRPIGYPNILVNDYEASIKNLDKMLKKFPESIELYTKLKNHLEALVESPLQKSHKANNKILEKYGFKPIKIGGYYAPDINFLNAIAYKNQNNKITYITNSTKHSYPELEYLEKLFEKDLRKKVKDIDKTYFVSGGPKDKPSCEKTDENKNPFDISSEFTRSREKSNSIMKILADRLGGIHCMSAEIPDFEKLN